MNQNNSARALDSVNQDWLAAYTITAEVLAEMHAIGFRKLADALGTETAVQLAPALLPSIVESAEKEALAIHRQALAAAQEEAERSTLEQMQKLHEERAQHAANQTPDNPW